MDKRNQSVEDNVASYNRTGERLGKLVAESPAGMNSRKEMRWLYRCDCGGETVQYPHAAKITRHCGCETKERLRNRSLTHGQSGTKVYKAYKAMIYRCHSPTSGSFKDYGARGISVCQRWRDSFDAFIADMGERPSGATIERIDNDGNYEPGNCVWATRKAQQRNRRANHVIERNGQSMCIAEWSEITGVPYSTIAGRIRRGWPEADAVSRPVQEQNRNSKAG